MSTRSHKIESLFCVTIFLLCNGCGPAAKKRRLEAENPGCTFDEDFGLICPSPFQKEINDAIETLPKKKVRK